MMKKRILYIMLMGIMMLSYGCDTDRQDSAPEAAPVGDLAEADTSNANTPIATQVTSDSPGDMEAPATISILDLYPSWDGKLSCGQRSYRPGSTIYHHGQTMACTLSFPYQNNLNTTTDDLLVLEEKYISMPHATRMKYIHLSTTTQYPNQIQFRFDPPWGPFLVQFHQEGLQEPFAFHFEYIDPFTYTIGRPFEADNAVQETGIRHYLLTGESHIYNISFSEPVERSAVEQHLAVNLGLVMDIEWLTDRSLQLTLHLKPEDRLEEYDEYRIQFSNQVAQREAAALSQHTSSDMVAFQPAAMKQYYAANPFTGAEEPLFDSLISYSSLMPSPDGKWILAEELRGSQSVLIPAYVLLDRDGRRLKELHIQEPVWLKGGNALLYKDRDSVKIYKIPTGETRVIWSMTDEPEMLSYQYDPYSGQLLVAAAYSDENSIVPVDLYLYEHIEDVNPSVFHKMFNNIEDIMWYGLHYSLPAHLIGEDWLFFTDRISENETKPVMMNVKSGATRNLEPLSGELLPLYQGKLLEIADGRVYVYDAVRDEKTALPLEFEHGTWLRAKLIQENKALLVISGKASYIIDLISLSLQALPDQWHLYSGNSHDGTIIWAKPDMSQ